MTLDELNVAFNIKQRIDRVQDQINSLMETGGVGSSCGKEMGRGGEYAGAGQAVVELFDEISSLESDLLLERKIVKRRIEGLPLTEMEERLMYLRYVECLPWNTIAQRIAYTKRHTTRMHKELLRNILTS